MRVGWSKLGLRFLSSGKQTTDSRPKIFSNRLKTINYAEKCLNGLPRPVQVSSYKEKSDDMWEEQKRVQKNGKANQGGDILLIK